MTPLRQYDPWDSYNHVDGWLGRMFTNEMFIRDQICDEPVTEQFYRASHHDFWTYGYIWGSH